MKILERFHLASPVLRACGLNIFRLGTGNTYFYTEQLNGVLKEFDNKTVFNYTKRQWLRTKNTSFRWEVNFLGIKWRTSESSTNINGRIRKYVRTGGEENSFHTVLKHTYSDSWAYNEVLREILMFNHFSRLYWYELTQIWNKWVITSKEGLNGVKRAKFHRQPLKSKNILTVNCHKVDRSKVAVKRFKVL